MSTSDQALLRRIKALTKRVKELETKTTTTITTTVTVSTTSSKPKPRPGACCFRCGRPGHFIGDCYATYHANGYEIDE